LNGSLHGGLLFGSLHRASILHSVTTAAAVAAIATTIAATVAAIPAVAAIAPVATITSVAAVSTVATIAAVAATAIAGMATVAAIAAVGAIAPVAAMAQGGRLVFTAHKGDPNQREKDSDTENDNTIHPQILQLLTGTVSGNDYVAVCIPTPSRSSTAERQDATCSVAMGCSSCR
jgi:hypothetical protein